LRGVELGSRLLRVFAAYNDPPSLEGPLPTLAAQVVSGAAAREFPAMVTIWAAQATGQPNPATVNAGACWLGLYLAAKILDDIQDGDVGILPPDVPEATGTNLALALIFAAQSCLVDGADGGPARSVAMARAACAHSLRTIGGQQMGMLAPSSRDELLSRAWLQAHEKGGRPFALACCLGALSVGAREHVAAGLEAYGMVVGEAVQAIDDGLDVLKADPRELTNVSGSLALAYAHGVADGEDAAQLLALEAAIREGDASAPAALRDKLVQMGAIRYLTIEAMARVLRARSLLKQLEPELQPEGYEPLWRVTEWLEPMAGLRQG
jgi:hypothetical protein